MARRKVCARRLSQKEEWTNTQGCGTYSKKEIDMETDFCIMCEGKLDDGDEKNAGFCYHCQIVMYRELVQEAETRLRMEA